jgi:hypothetical protein
MSFDARSREQLAALGRQLPQKLPPPSPAAPIPQGDPASQGRHPLELERNPQQLFRELMQASADGTVPPHLLDRLRQLESDAKSTALAQANDSPAGTPPGGTAAPAGASRQRSSKGSRPRLGQGPKGPRRVEGADAELYISFQQLLLEDDEWDGASAPKDRTPT